MIIFFYNEGSATNISFFKLSETKAFKLIHMQHVYKLRKKDEKLCNIKLLKKHFSALNVKKRKRNNSAKLHLFIVNLKRFMII